MKSKTLKSFLIAMSLLIVTTTIIGTFQTAYAAVTVTFNYTTATNSSDSPLLFGGSNEPSPEHNSNIYPKLKGAGLKYQRGTIHMDTLLPSNITLADYKNNVNNVQDPNTWDWTGLQWVDFAKANGITTMLNMFYAPPWLTYSGTAKGVPKDWSVYQDIIKKVITKYGSKLDYVEPLNAITPANKENITFLKTPLLILLPPFYFKTLLSMVKHGCSQNLFITSYSHCTWATLKLTNLFLTINLDF
ncbi:hypothetical protein [Paenibacillus sp. Soil750]|uniref:hypothetical protein n=1 Tax=Paenibacillus sp. Soil750 TaxID=1736398 RepID=UPI0006FDAD52|nr:hypothetical protein [Paenibacillus sp. Soil750]KRE69736.1 hypothetical protein ASL11_15335 [Paenibacillus sp. Soil750]